MAVPAHLALRVQGSSYLPPCEERQPPLCPLPPVLNLLAFAAAQTCQAGDGQCPAQCKNTPLAKGGYGSRAGHGSCDKAQLDLTGATIKADAHAAAAAAAAGRAARGFFIAAPATIGHGDAANIAHTRLAIGGGARRAAASAAFH